MKKIISLFASLAIMSSLCVVNVSAATISVTIPEAEEMTATDLAEFNTYLEEDLGEDTISVAEGYKAYKVTFNMSGLPIYNSTNKNRIMAFECGLNFKEDTGYATTQAAALYGESVISAPAQLTNDEVSGEPVYRASYIKTAYADMYSVKSETMDNAMVMVVVAKPGTKATPFVSYTEWYNATKAEVPAGVNITPTTITLGSTASDPDPAPTIPEVIADNVMYAGKIDVSKLQDSTTFEIEYTGSNAEISENGAKTKKTIQRNLGQILGGEGITVNSLIGSLHFGIKLPAGIAGTAESANFKVNVLNQVE